MSIEVSGNASSHKTVAGTENHAAKGKGKAKSGGEAAPLAGGFSALLMSIGSEGSVDGGTEPGDQPKGGDTPLTKDEQAPLAVMLPSNVLVSFDQNVPIDVAMLLAQAGEVAGGRTTVPNSESALGEKSPLAVLLPPGVSVLSVQSFPVNGAMQTAQAGEVVGDRVSTVADAQPVIGNNAGHLTAPATGSEKREVLVDASAALDADNSEENRQNVEALLGQMEQTQPAQTRKFAGAESHASAGALLAESRAVKSTAIADALANAPAVSGTLASSGIGDGYLRPMDRLTTKSSTPLAGSGVESIWGSHALLTGSRVDSPSPASDSSAMSLESTVANTVSYWVTQGIQNAELKLDGFGGESVEVSISLKGDEAHIDFRTDQPEIRQVLEGAVAHLKELLGNEGLVLSGVSVGTSGQDGNGSQERRNRPDASAATILVKDEVPSEIRQRVNPAVGRALDVFV